MGYSVPRRHAVNEWVFVQQRGRFTGQPYTENRAFPQDLCSLAKVKPFGCHGIRGLTASLLYDSGVPNAVIQAILGHARASTTDIYIRNLGLGTTDGRHLEVLPGGKAAQTAAQSKRKGLHAANV